MLNYHTAMACSPTRAMVMSGTDAHVGGLGCLIEYKLDLMGKQRWSGKAGYEGFLNNDVAVLPEILEDNGYHTMLAGKWHLGMRRDQGPWRAASSGRLQCCPGAPTITAGSLCSRTDTAECHSLLVTVPFMQRTGCMQKCESSAGAVLNLVGSLTRRTTPMAFTRPTSTPTRWSSTSLQGPKRRRPSRFSGTSRFQLHIGHYSRQNRPAKSESRCGGLGRCLRYRGAYDAGPLPYARNA